MTRVEPAIERHLETAVDGRRILNIRIANPQNKHLLVTWLA